jgi:hypothetical protein
MSFITSKQKNESSELVCGTAILERKIMRIGQELCSVKLSLIQTHSVFTNEYMSELFQILSTNENQIYNSM